MMTEIIAPIVNFTVVVGILAYFGRKPVADLFSNRSKTLADSIRGAEAEAAEADALLAKWAKKKTSSEEEAKQSQEDAQARVRMLKESRVAAAKTAAERIVQDAKLVGQTEANRGREGLQREVVRRSVALAREFLASHVGEKDRHQLVTDYLELLGNGSAR